MSEQVMVFEESLIREYLPKFKNGIIKDYKTIGEITNLIFGYKDCCGEENNYTYIDRDYAETNPDFKQIIPYCVIHKDGLILTYQRTKKGGEARLHDKYSLGVGGHINDTDENYVQSLKRELKEELGLVLDHDNLNIIGIIYDNSNDVGKVHVGIVHLIKVGSDSQFSPQEAAISKVRWTNKQEREGMEFENWSKIVLDNLKSVLPGE